MKKSTSIAGKHVASQRNSEGSTSRHIPAGVLAYGLSVCLSAVPKHEVETRQQLCGFLHMFCSGGATDN